MKWVVQGLTWLVFCLVIGVFTARPELRLLADDEAVISISFSHAGQRVGECKRLSQEELMALPPNMRKPDECPRERHPVEIELLVDGATLYSATLAPSGLWSDGKATVYQRVPVPSGTQTVTARMNDSGRPDGFDFETSTVVDLQPGHNFVIYFDEGNEQFVFK